ncbi:S41 family peptidase [Pedobacter sp. MC2016-15]|uniref:S41 family peptidase n=1 Tax=Pedobacter sp. MC2016-15 TaxID=2994473 RepID=UPI002246E902|nr:S41 family peptidase [Pedobacter sp. MC2016-15]MCX2478250.1 S41 family peptidase [Pedobacter sp. MC2016-15]
MKLLPLIALLTYSTASFAQVCDCQKEFADVKDKIERNYAGFKDKVNDQTLAGYQKHTETALEKSKPITKPAYCVSLISDWLKFFRDGHIQIGRNRISAETEKLWLKRRTGELEHINVSDKELSALRGSKAVAGIYFDEDSTSRIAILKNKNSFRDYVGVVISSAKGKWLPGEVVMELKEGQDTLKGILYDKYYIPNSVLLDVKKNALGGWRREGSPRRNNIVVTETSVDSKVLSAKTLYLKISTFNQGNAANIDSLFKVNAGRLAAMPNLILDLRGNGGGADFSYRPITPYLYTGTMRLTGADVWSTDDNIAGWAAVATTPGLPPDQKTFIGEVIQKMSANKGKAVSFSEDRSITRDSIAAYPKKIIILMNKNCGSTTEEFLLMAKQSSKVTLMGEHTAGVLDYSNMRGGAFSCMPYMLYWATSRSRRIDQGLAIDNVGIRPDQLIAEGKDWIEEARNFAEK